MPKSKPYIIGLRDRLKDPEYASAYLNAARRESQEVFLLALRDVAEAHKITKVASAARVNRETLYRTLSAKGNPTLTTYDSLLDVLGVEYIFQPKRTQKKTAIAASSSRAKVAKVRQIAPTAVLVNNYGLDTGSVIDRLGKYLFDIPNVPVQPESSLDQIQISAAQYPIPELANFASSPYSAPLHA